MENYLRYQKIYRHFDTRQQSLENLSSWYVLWWNINSINAFQQMGHNVFNYIFQKKFQFIIYMPKVVYVSLSNFVCNLTLLRFAAFISIRLCIFRWEMFCVLDFVMLSRYTIFQSRLNSFRFLFASLNLPLERYWFQKRLFISVKL